MNGLLTEIGSGDLLIAGGGCAVGDTNAQTVEHVVTANRGEYREWPLLGGEIVRLQHGIGGQLWCQRARRMCEAAGAKVSRIAISGRGEVVIE